MDWRRWSRNPRVWAAVVVLALVAAGAGYYFFAPKPSRHVSEAAPQGGVALKTGMLQDGETFHEARGTVRLLQVGDRHVLRFEGYEATPGPDVYFYLTPTVRAATTEGVEEAGVRVPTPTMTGQATLRGDFNVELPEDVDPSRYAGLSVWCDAYNVLFGYAELAPA